MANSKNAQNVVILDSLAGSISSIALLKALAVPAGPIVLLVTGYAAAGDGGGGFYWWNAADVTADNGGTVIQLNAGGNGRFNKLF